jgi:predicted transcriptional regulator of viral defense system
MPTHRRDLRRALFALAAEQGGYFTAADAKAVGYSHQAQAYHVHAGNWHRIDRGLFRLSEWIPGPHDELIRWTLWSRKRAVVSHETALAVHEIGELESPRVHLTVPSGFTRRDPALVLHRQALPSHDIVEHPGFRVTTIARSLVDVAPTIDEDQLARAIAEAREAGVLSIRTLRDRAEAIDLRAALRIQEALARMGSAP